ILCPLHDKCRLRERIMIACMIEVEVSTNEGMDIVRSKANRSQLLKYVVLFSHLYNYSSKLLMRTNVLFGTACIDQNIDTIVGLNEVAWHGNVSWLQRSQLHKIETVRHT